MENMKNDCCVSQPSSQPDNAFKLQCKEFVLETNSEKTGNRLMFMSHQQKAVQRQNIKMDIKLFGNEAK
jgi:hypothetical protein